MARRRRQEALGRVVGIGGLFGTAYGDIATSIYLVLGAIGLFALGLTPLIILLVGVVFILTSWSYAEASSALPDSSGATSFARRAFDPMTGFSTAWTLLLDSGVVVALACLAVPHYLGALWPQLQVWPYDLAVGAGVLVVIVALNLLGVPESVRLSSLAAVLGFSTLILLLVVGLLVMLRPGDVWSQIQLGVAPTWGNLLWVLPLALGALLGIDTISSRAETALHPERDVPRALTVVPPLIVMLTAGLAFIALSVLPVGVKRGAGRSGDGTDAAGPGRPQRATGRLRDGRRPGHHGVRAGQARGRRLRHPGAKAGRPRHGGGRRPGHAALRHAARQRLPARPCHGPRRRPARGAGMAGATAQGVGGGRRLARAHPRRQRRGRRIRTHRLLARATPSGPGAARAHRHHPHDSIRGHHPVRDHRRRAAAAQGPAAAVRPAGVRGRARVRRSRTCR